MAISYPLALPTVTGVSKVVLRKTSIVAIARSPYTGVEQVHKHAGQIWGAEISLPPMRRQDAEVWNAFLFKLDGMYGTFLLGDPLGATPRGVATGAPLVDGAGQTGNLLNTKGWTINITGIMKEGDYIQLGTGATSRLYKVLEDANSNGSGLSTLTIWPNLRSPSVDSATIVVNSAKGVFRLSENITSFEMDTLFYGINFSAVEMIDGT